MCVTLKGGTFTCIHDYLLREHDLISIFTRFWSLTKRTATLCGQNKGMSSQVVNMSAQQKEVQLWTSKLGKTYQKDQVDFDTAAKELESIRNQPSNKRCADCGAYGTVWSSVNLGVFTCMRCGSFHRALGTHISKPKGCTGTYLWWANYRIHVSKAFQWIFISNTVTLINSQVARRSGEYEKHW